MPSKTWTNYSPEEREQIEINRKKASYKSPFSGKNSAQRRHLHNEFNSMAGVWRKLGMK